jgi:anti-sigma factor RsiW
MRDLLGHRRMRRAVEAYLDGELSPEAVAQVARHLSICWDCSALAETLLLLRRSLRRRRETTPQTVTERRLRRFAENLVAGQNLP